MSKKNLHTLVIEKLIPGGLGLGRLEDGIIVLVRHVLPGEKVLVRKENRKKDYITATLMEVLAPSPDRIDPPCPIYGRCGGCDMQHAKPEAQLRLKQATLKESLFRSAGTVFADPAHWLEAPLAAPDQFGYRQRLRLQVDKNGSWGFFRPQSHVIEPVSECLLAGAELNALLRLLSFSDSFKGLAQHCSAFELLFSPGENNVVMLLSFQRRPRPADSILAKDIAHSLQGLSHILMQVEGYGLYDPLQQTFPASPPTLSHTLNVDVIGTKLTLLWEAGAFCQVNLGQNANLVQLVLEMLASGPCRRVLDLYCGYGNFSLPVAKLAHEVFGVDVQSAAIRSAQQNALRNGIQNCFFEKKQVPIAVKTLVASGKSFETIVLDPPREGAAEIMPLLPRLNAEQIIYISCNPATLARDLASLAATGYSLIRMVPVDMFPQTHHLESVALLKSASS